MTQLDELSAWKRRYGDNPAPLERLLGRLAGSRFRVAGDLIQLHETLLFLRAYPHSAEIARLSDELLANFSSRFALLDDATPLEDPEVSGIAGTSITGLFTYETARSLAARNGDAIDVDWESTDPDRMGPTLAGIAPIVGEEWPVEAHLPAREWIDKLKSPSQTALQWLLSRIECAEQYDRMDLTLVWRLNESVAARNHTRYGNAPLFIHSEPLIRRNEVSLERELSGPPLPVERLSQRDARAALDLIVDTSAVRYRQLYGFSHPDLRRVYRADAGRGVEILFFGIPPERRLPLRAYHAGMFFKNGVPAGYIELLSFFERAEVGFNLYYTFREGETAWIYAKVLRLCKQLLGVTHYYLDPYQIGNENEEAIDAGAFWFYRKLGFRSVDPALVKLTEAEESRIANNSEYRTPPRTLRKLSRRPMIYEPQNEATGDWDNFQIRTLAQACWPGPVRRAFDELRPLKYGANESDYLKGMRRERKLRVALIELGGHILSTEPDNS
jgi:hypothetical protein